MARGDRREPIVRDDGDRKAFLRTLGEMCGRTGIEVHAYVLLDNHFHLVLATPEGNLVDGMRWFQNTFTRRFNVCHGLWGHLYGGRYKAILIDRGKIGLGGCLLGAWPVFAGDHSARMVFWVPGFQRAHVGVDRGGRRLREEWRRLSRRRVAGSWRGACPENSGGWLRSPRNRVR